MRSCCSWQPRALRLGEGWKLTCLLMFFREHLRCLLKLMKIKQAQGGLLSKSRLKSQSPVWFSALPSPPFFYHPLSYLSVKKNHFLS